MTTLLACLGFVGLACERRAPRPPAVEGAASSPIAPPAPAIAPSPGTSAVTTAAASDDAAFRQYPERLRAHAAIRARFSREARAAPTGARRRALRGRARATLLRFFDETLFPAWRGTRWDYGGTSLRPREGTIACGYFVTTLLAHAGLRVERVRLAQQASERIVRTLVPARAIRRFSDRSAADVLATIRKQGDGLYVVGLDNHVGFLRVRDERVDFCHSSYVAPGSALCEGALEAVAFRSRYRVVGKLFEPELVDAWLAARAIPTR